MDEPGDEDGGSRVPSRPTVTKKDGLDDPALADAGPDLDPPGETVNQGPNHSAAVAEESHPHDVDDDLNESAAGVSGNLDDVRPQSGLNSGDTGTEAVSIVLDGVAPVDTNLDGISAEVVQSPSNVAVGGISNPNNVAQSKVVGTPASDVASGAVGKLGGTGPAAVSNRDDAALELHNSGNVSPEMVGNFDDDARGAVENPNDIASDAVLKPSDVAYGLVRDPGINAPGLILNPGDGGPVTVSKRNSVCSVVGTSNNVGSEAVVNSGDVAIGAAQNVNDATPGAISNPGDNASGVAGNSDNDALETGQILSNVAARADVLNLDDVAPRVTPENVVRESVLNPRYCDLVPAPNLAHLAGNPRDAALGLVQNPGNVEQSEIVELEQNSALEAKHQNKDQIPRNIVPTTILGNDRQGAAENHNNTAHEGAETEDEDSWRSAVAEQDCEKLTELLAKNVTYFWKYEMKNELGTALHAAARRGDLELAEHILIMLSWAQEAGDQDMHFFDKNLDKDGYVELERDGKTAADVAQENNHVAIDKRIRDYIANKDQVRIYEKRIGSNGAVPKILRWNDSFLKKDLAPQQISDWNDAIKKKDCLALLNICPHSSLDPPRIDEETTLKLVRELRILEVKNGVEGRQTALQTAAMQGCFELTEKLLNKLFLRYFHSYLMARNEESGLTAFEMANDVIGNRSISEIVKTQLKRQSEKLERRLHLNLENDNHRITKDDGGLDPLLVSFDAYPGTRWHRALENGDTRELKKLVEGNSRFILESCHGLTILHVAILRDNLELVKVVFNLFCTELKHGGSCIKWGKSYYPVELSLHDMMNEHRKIRWDAFSEWLSLPKGLLKQLKRKGHSLMSFVELWEKQWPGHSEILDECKKARRFPSSIPTPDAEYSSMPSRISNLFTKYWPSKLDKAFQEDVDFNFEDSGRKKWLKFHYACKYPLEFKGFLQEMASYILQHPYDATKLLQTWDGKGRTAFHILMDHYTNEMDPGWPFHEIFKHDYFKEWIQIVENPRGKRIIDIILLKNYLQQDVTLQPWTYFKIKFDYKSFDNLLVNSFLYCQVAHLLKQKDVLQEIWSRILKKRDLSVVMKEDQKAFNSMLFLVASNGNQTSLQSLLKINKDPMITDSNGRSLLHHAADPTILLSQLLGHCSLIVEDVFMVRRKFMGSNTISDSQPSSSSTCDANHNGSNIVQQVGSNIVQQVGSNIVQQVGSNIVQQVGSNIVQQVGSNSTKECNTTNFNSIHARKPSTIDISSGERSNVGRKACILMLLQAGVDLGQVDNDNEVPTIGLIVDATYQSWWYDIVVKDSTDKKQALNQAGNALSVVGTLVAATSYIGPLQPPLGFDTDVGIGSVKTTEPLIRVFMVSNLVAFYLAMASVMFAVVSSLPMPQEGVLSELNRAKHVISLSLCLLQIAIGSIIISFASASIVAVRNEHFFHPSDLLFSPSIIGWFFCLLGIGGFLIRLARLVFYKNSVVRKIYQFSFSKNIPWALLVVLFGSVYYPLDMILVCLQFLFDGVPLSSAHTVMDLWFMRRRLKAFFHDVLTRSA